MIYKISVVIPVYNAEDTVERAINSLFAQNWEGNFEEDIEIVLIDDNSSDNSLNIIKRLSEKHENIVYYHFTNNSGFGGRGRNKGISIAKGEYIVLMDNDDIYLQDALQLFHDTITQTGSDIVLANYETDFLIQRRYCPKGYDNNWTLNPTQNQRRFDILTATCSFAPWAKIYKKSFLQDNGITFVEDSQYDDADFFIKCMLSAKQITILPNDYVYMYYTYESSQVRLHDNEHFYARVKTMREIDSLVKNKGFSVDSFIRYSLMELFLIIANSNESKKDTFLMFDELSKLQVDFCITTYKKFEINFLNKFIMSNHYTMAYYISKIYAFFYRISFIRNIYRSIGNANKRVD